MKKCPSCGCNLVRLDLANEDIVVCEDCGWMESPEVLKEFLEQDRPIGKSQDLPTVWNAVVTEAESKLAWWGKLDECYYHERMMTQRCICEFMGYGAFSPLLSQHGGVTHRKAAVL